MRRLVEDDVQSRLFRAERRRPRPADHRGADLAQVGVGHPADARPARRPAAVAGEAQAARRRRRAAVDRRAAGDEHDLGRRRRAAARRDGRRRPAEEHQRVHPGDQPRRPRASRAWCSRSTTGRARATCRTTRRSSTTTAPLPPGRGAVGHAVRAARARPRADRRARLAAAALGPEWNPNRGAALVDPAARARAAGARGDPRARRRPDRPRRPPTSSPSGSTMRLDAWKAEATGRPAHARLPAPRQERRRRLAAAGARHRGLGATGPCRRRCATSRPPCRWRCAPSGIAPPPTTGRRPSARRRCPTRRTTREVARPRRRAAPEPAAAHLRRRRDRRAARDDDARARPRRLAASARRAGLRAAAARRRARRARARRSSSCSRRPSCPRATSAGVPVAPFPRWLRCPLCSLLAPIDHGLFTLRADAWRPERTTYVHEGCPKSARAPAADRVPGALPDGLRRTATSTTSRGSSSSTAASPCRGTLRLASSAPAARAGDVQLSCDECRRRRRLSQAFGEEAAPFLPPRCRGRHPHLGITERAASSSRETLILGASNAWFPVQSSALSIPSRGGRAGAGGRRGLGDPRAAAAGRGRSSSYALEDERRPQEAAGARRRASGIDAVEQAIDAAPRRARRRRPRGPAHAGVARALRTRRRRPRRRDFKLRAVGAPRAVRRPIADVVLVERLREVSALRGFTRLNAPDDLDARGGTIAPLSRASRRAGCRAARSAARASSSASPRSESLAVGAALPRQRRRGAACATRTAAGATRRGLAAGRGLARRALRPAALVRARADPRARAGVRLHRVVDPRAASTPPTAGRRADGRRAALHRRARQRGHARRARVARRARAARPAAAPGARARAAVLVGPAVLRARPARGRLASTPPPATPASSRPRPRASAATASSTGPRSSPTLAARRRRPTSPRRERRRARRATCSTRLSDAQVEALAAACDGAQRPAARSRRSSPARTPGAHDAVAALAAAWAAAPALTGDGVALALRVGLRARRDADGPPLAARSGPGPERPASSASPRPCCTSSSPAPASACCSSASPPTRSPSSPTISRPPSTRGCTVDVVFETEEDSAGAYSGPQSQAVRRGARRTALALAGRPAHARRRAARQAARRRRRRALVGSANLTHRALTANLEAGVLIEDPDLAAELEAHVRTLMARGTLVGADEPVTG